MIFEVTLLGARTVHVGFYPNAKDEEEARSMMFRDHSEEVFEMFCDSKPVRFAVQKVTPEQMEKKEALLDKRGTFVL